MIFILQKQVYNNKMQHTTTSKEKPNLLFENFIISGLSQHELMDLDLNNKNDTTKRDPQVLFSMFEDEQKCENFLQFIWPNKMNIYNSKQEPQTHSFNVMDSNRNQTFFHCLTFTEEVCSYLVKNDFDANGAQGQKILDHLQKKVNKKTSVADEDGGEGDLLAINKAEQNKIKLQKQIERKLQVDIKEKFKTLQNKQNFKESKSKSPVKHFGIPNEQERFLMNINKGRHHACGTVINIQKRDDEAKKESEKKKEQQAKLQNFKKMQLTSQQNQVAAHKAITDIRGTVMKNASFIISTNDQRQRTASNVNILLKPLQQKNVSDKLNNDGSFAFEEDAFPKDIISEKSIKFAKVLSAVQGFNQKNNNFGESLQFDTRISNNSSYLRRPNGNHTVAIKERTVSFDVRNSRKLDMQSIQGFSLSNIDADQLTPGFKILDQNPAKLNQGYNLDLKKTASFQNPDQEFKERQELFYNSNRRNDVFQSFNQSFLANPHMITEESQDVSEDQFEIEDIFQDVQHHNQELQEEKFVPVALVIQTKLEYHDHFRLILRSIYEIIVNRKQSFSDSLTDQYNSFGEMIYAGKVNDQEELQIDNLQFDSEQEAIEVGTEVFKNVPDINRCMAFAHMIATLSFLRTIPPPVFNSEVNILLNNKLLNFKENCFDQIPHKNNCLIKTIQVLDFQTILTCLKGLIFEKTLIVLSTEVSLLFDVIEGLKQLIFPFTFDYASFLPANDIYLDSREVTLKQFFLDSDGFQPAIFAMKANPGEIEDFIQYPDAVILHIDCSMAILSKNQDSDEGKLPEFPNEFFLLQELNILKNGCFQKFGKLHKNSPGSLETDSSTNMAIEIKNIIFKQFHFLLQKSFEFIKIDIENPKASEFLNKKLLKELIKDECCQTSQNFFLKLIETTCFVNFIDGYLDSEITNFDIVNSILLKNNNKLKKRYKIQNNTFTKFIPQIQKSVETLKQNDFDLLNCMYQINQKQFDIFEQDDQKEIQIDQDFEDSIIVFNYTMPTDRTCASLFQRLQMYGQIKKKNHKNGEDGKQKKYSDMTQKVLISLIDYVYKNSDEQKLLDEEQKNAYHKMKNNLIESQQSSNQTILSPLNIYPTNNLNVQDLKLKAQNSNTLNNLNLQFQKIQSIDIPYHSLKTQFTNTSQIYQNQGQQFNPNQSSGNKYYSEMSQSPYKFYDEMNNSYLTILVEKLPVLTAFIKKAEMKSTQQNSDGQFDLFGQNLIQFLKETSDQQYLTVQQQRVYSQVKQFLMIIEQKQERSIIYGRKGLLSFLNNLFLDVPEKLKRLFNFYFNIKDHIQDFVQQKIIARQKKTQSLIDFITANQNQQDYLNQSVNSDNNPPQNLRLKSNPSLQSGVNNKINATKAEELFKKNALLLQQGRLQEMLKSNPVQQIQSNNQNFVSNHLQKLQKAANSILLNEVPFQYQIQLLNLQQNFLNQESTDLQSLPESFDTFKDMSQNIQDFQDNFQFLASQQYSKETMNDLQQNLIEQKQFFENSKTLTQNKFGKKHMWFWIETNKSECLQNDDESCFNNPLSYQEILTVMKFIINFENKNCYNHMLLQLFVNFPNCSLDYNQILNENLQQYNLEKLSAWPEKKQKQILINDREIDNEIDQLSSEIIRFNDAAQESQLDDQRFKKVISIVKKQTDQNKNLKQINRSKRNIIQNCLFPFNDIQIILDNLSRQQLIDLYLRIFQGSLTVLKSECISSQERANMFSKDDQKILNYGLNQVCRSAPWCFPSDQKVDHVSSCQILNLNFPQNLEESQMTNEILHGLNEILIKQNYFKHPEEQINQYTAEKIQLNKFILHPVLFLIQLKFFEVLYFSRLDMFKDPKCQEIIQNFTNEKFTKPMQKIISRDETYDQGSLEQINSLFFNDLSKIFEKIDKLQQDKIIFLNKRDTDKSLSNAYFEIIDEREFYNCCIEIEIKRREDQRQQFITESYVENEDERNMISVSFFDKNKVDNGTLCESVGVIVQKQPQNQIEKFIGKVNEKISLVQGRYEADNYNVNQKQEKRNSSQNIDSQISKTSCKKQLQRKNMSYKSPINNLTESQQISNLQFPANDQNQTFLLTPRMNSSNRLGSSFKPTQSRPSKNFLSGVLNIFKKTTEESKKSIKHSKSQSSFLKHSEYQNKTCSQQIETEQDKQIIIEDVSIRKSTFRSDQNEFSQGFNPQDSLQLNDGFNPQDSLTPRNVAQIQYSIQVKGRSVAKKRIQVSPIELSLNFLLQIAEFWEENQLILNKSNYDQHSSPKEIKERYDSLVKIFQEHQKVIIDYEPIFYHQNESHGDSKIQEISEISKQIFYVNLYNAIILFKLAELACYKNKLLFDLKGLQSWAALEHNSRIIIGNRSFSAYQIRYDIVKNIQKQKTDNYHVDQRYVLPLIDYAFFKPTSGSLNLSGLLFSDPEKIKVDLQIQIRAYLKNKLKFKENFCPILLPCDLKSVMPENLTKPVIQLMQQWENEDKLTHQRFNSESKQQIENKFRQNVKLGYFRQKQVVEILKFIQTNILECDNEDNSLDELKKQTKKMIENINQNLNECEQTGDMSVLPNYFCEYYSAPVFKLKKDKIIYGLQKAIHSI